MQQDIAVSKYLPSRYLGFPSGAVVKNLLDNAGNTKDSGLIPGLGMSPGEGNGNILQYSCLGNSMDRGAWRATVHGVAKNWTCRCDKNLDLEKCFLF